MYYIKIYSGFPIGKSEEQYTTPDFEQDYTWWDDYDQVMVDFGNCLKGSCKSYPYHTFTPSIFSLSLSFPFLCHGFFLLLDFREQEQTQLTFPKS